MSRSDMRFGMALVGGAAVGAAAIYKAFADAREERVRQESIEAVCKQIKDDYPRILADHLIGKFRASDFSPSFDFDGEINKWHDNKLYKFLLFNMNEYFADIVFQKKEKFSKFDLQIPLSDLLDRALADAKYEGFNGDSLLDQFKTFLKGEDQNYSADINGVSQEALQAVRADEIILEKRENFFKSSNVFMTNTGPVLLTDDYRCLQFIDGKIIVFAELADYQEANKSNKKWDYVMEESKKKELVGHLLEEILVKLYVEKRGLK